MICAISKNGVIGKGNSLLYKLPKEMKSFVTLTTGRTVIMGRKTYESINRPLPNRVNVVITRQANYKLEGCVVVHSLTEAISYAKEQGESEAIIIGGGQIYQEGLKIAQKMYLTHVEAESEGDTYFPQWNPSEWKKSLLATHNIDEKHAYRFSIWVYERIDV